MKLGYIISKNTSIFELFSTFRGLKERYKKIERIFNKQNAHGRAGDLETLSIKMINSASLAVKAIDYYQSNLSHKKKYKCAHGALQKGLTCSAYSRARIIKKGFWLGSIDTIRRLFGCWEASKEIKENSILVSKSEQTKPEKKKPNDDSVGSCTKGYLLGEATCCIASLLPW
jgi:putative component of membrane protein insertase Oxa1/YidC/SpoIIIJ protein YidD